MFESTVKIIVGRAGGTTQSLRHHSLSCHIS